MPEVSVIIPTYNSAHYVTEAVDSVLGQSYRDFEIVVIDDGSTDDTRSVMSRYGSPVRYLRQPNGGVAEARNRGIEESRGRYVAFLDADDTWAPNKLEQQVEALRNDPGRKACYTAVTVTDADLTPVSVTRSRRRGRAMEDLLYLGNVVGTPSTVICERALLQSAGGFDLSLSQCADWDMWIRLAARTDFLYLDEPLVKYRVHATNMSRNAALLEEDSLRVLEKSFDMPGLPAALRSRRRAAFAHNYMVLAGTYSHARRYADFARCASRAVALDFRQVGYLIKFPARALARLLSRPEAGISNVKTA